MLVLQPWVQTPPTTSQTPLWHWALLEQVPQRAEPLATVPHWQAPKEHASPPHSVGVVQNVPLPKLQWLVPSQLPLWQSLFCAQVAQIGEPAGGLQLQVWPPPPPLLVQMAPVGQLAELAQRWVQVCVAMSQSWLTQSAAELQLEQVAAGQAQSPPLQLAPLHCAEVVQAVSQSSVVGSQCPLAQSLFWAQVPQSAMPVLAQSQTLVAPPSGSTAQVWPPHWLAVAQTPEQVWVAASQVPLTQSVSSVQAPQVATEPARAQSQRPGPPSGSDKLHA